MSEIKLPGVYIEELPKLPPTILSVETAIPAFIGYTEKANKGNDGGSLIEKPFRIDSLLDYELHFGGPPIEIDSISVTVDATQNHVQVKGTIDSLKASKYLMYHSLEMYFLNGGGPCYIIPVGDYSSGYLDIASLRAGLAAAEHLNEITLIVFPDGLNMGSAADYYAIHKEALEQCSLRKDRFVIMDIWIDPDPEVNNIEVFRSTDMGGIENRKYGAIYYPRIYTGLNYTYDENAVQVIQIDNRDSLHSTLSELKSQNNARYFQCKQAINQIEMLLPASPAVAGKYAETDNTRGVWKAPANISIDHAIRPERMISNQEQMYLSTDEAEGKSINAIRSFPGRGPAMIWGARTMAGNDQDWRYISVLRSCIMVEESIKNATGQFVFEPNDVNTWIRVKSMIANYLTQQWKAGALQGTTTREAFFVQVGLNETMTDQDIAEGYMIIEIGLAIVRPAEFILIGFKQMMLAES